MRTIRIFLAAGLFFCGSKLYSQHRIEQLKQSRKQYQTSHFRFYVEPRSLADSAHSFLEKSLESYRADILSAIGEEAYEPIIDVLFFSDKEGLKKAFRKEVEGISFASDQLAVFVFSRNFSGFSRHEITHVISINLWGHSALWMEEGLATLMDEDMQTRDFHAQAKALLGTPQFIGPANLFRHFNRYGGQWARYVEAASMLKFLRARYGLPALRAAWVAREYSVPGVTQEELVESWLAFLRDK